MNRNATALFLCGTQILNRRTSEAASRWTEVVTAVLTEKWAECLGGGRCGDGILSECGSRCGLGRPHYSFAGVVWGEGVFSKVQWKAI